MCLCSRLELKLTANLALLPSSRKNDKRTHESPTPLRILINNIPLYISDAYVAILIFYLENKKNNAETTNTEKNSVSACSRKHGPSGNSDTLRQRARRSKTVAKVEGSAPVFNLIIIWITVYYGHWPHIWTHMFSFYRVAKSHWTAFSATRMLTRKHVLDQNIIKNIAYIVVCHPMLSITFIWKLHLIFTGCLFTKMCDASWMAYSLYGNHILFCIYLSLPL